MKKVATIVLTAAFGLGVALTGSVFASEAGLAMPSMKDIAKTTAKQMAEEKMDAAHQKASKKLNEMVDGKATNATKEATNATEEKTEKAKHEMHEMKEKSEHEMHEMHHGK